MYSDDFKKTINDNKVLLAHSGLLKKLSDDGIMCVGYGEDGGFYLVECCDEFFYHDLTKEECIELSEMFKEIAKAAESKNGKTSDSKTTKETENRK